MDTHDDGWFGEEVAARYDDPTDEANTPASIEPVVDALVGLAGDDPVLEFAIGTGRIALPLARRGIEVHGIDLSRAMVDQMRAKPGGRDLPVTIGDMATTRIEAGASFGLVFLVFNTIMNLTSQDAQVACFRNAAAHLRPGGCFVVEVSVPDLQRLPPGETVHPFHVGPDRLGFDEYDLADQGMVSHHLRVHDDNTATRVSVPFRYAWPAELDLMARLAGMRLRHRWHDWSGAPFTAASRQHVSVWELPPDDPG